jgi:hypothetical protein
MWFDNLLRSLRDLVAGLGQAVFRFYAETEVAGTRRLFFLSPVLNNDLDTNGSGGADLRVRVLPHVSLPPDGLAVTFERLTTDVRGLSARVWIGIDGGVLPVGTPPPQMQFAVVGFEGRPGLLPPRELVVDLVQRTTGDRSQVLLDVTMRGVPRDAGRLRAGLVTGPPSVEAADRVPGTGTTIRTANPAAAAQLTQALLQLRPAADPDTWSLDPPLHLAVDSGPDDTSALFTAPAPVALRAEIESRGPGVTQLLAETAALPTRLEVTVGATEAVVAPNSAVTLDLRGVGLPAGLPGLTTASARVTLPALPLRLAWGPAPLLVDVGLRPGAAGPLALAANALLSAAGTPLGAVPPPPEPRQALVAEYQEGRELWVAVNRLGGLRLTSEQAPPRTSLRGRLTLADPAEGSRLPPRSVRLAARTSPARGLSGDVRVSALEPVTTGRATLAVDLDLGPATVTAHVEGRLRHLRAVLDDGRARTEAWTPVTPATLDLRVGSGDRVDVGLVPGSAMAVTADRVSYAGSPLGGYARLFGRLLLGARLTGHYAMTPRQPEVRGTAAATSSAAETVDSAGTAFPPELAGMALRYESGSNAGISRTIRSVGTGRLTTDPPFPTAPVAGDRFVVVSVDALLDAATPPARPSTRSGVSATVSATAARDRRMATRINPQLVRQATRRWLPLVGATGPDEPDGVAARVEGVLRAQVPPPVGPGQGWLALDLVLDGARPRRSMRYAENRRLILPPAVADAVGAGASSQLRPAPRVRALLADLPDEVLVRSSAGAGTQTYSVTRNGARSGGGWVWALTEQKRGTGALAGIGVVSLDVAALPQRVGVVLATSLADVRRRTPPGDVMWTPPASWLPPDSQTVVISGGDLRLTRVVLATYWPGPGGSAQSYPARDEDEWGLTTATELHLHDTGAADQRVTVWMLDQRDRSDPDRSSGIGVEAIGLNADLDLDRYRALVPAGTPPAVRHYATLRWEKGSEIQLQGYTGAWTKTAASGTGVDYERPSEDVGFWFLRAVNSLKLTGLLNFGDAYFGNTSGNINGRGRLYP